MTPPRRLYAALPQGDEPSVGDLGAALDLAEALEAAGVGGVAVADHVVMGEHLDYPWGTFPVAPDSPFPEPLTVLAAIAARTTSLRLTTDVLIAPLRPAALLAKTAATVDVISGGRLDLAVGVGWHEDEFVACGADFTGRGRALTDGIAAARALWADGPARFESTTVSFGPVHCSPAPVQAGGPPVLFGGKLNPRNLGRIVELGDGWSVELGLDADALPGEIRRLRDAWRAVGRTGEPRVRRRLRLPAADPAGVERLRQAATEALAAGVTEIVAPVGPFLVEHEASVAASMLADLWRDALAG